MSPSARVTVSRTDSGVGSGVSLGEGTAEGIGVMTAVGAIVGVIAVSGVGIRVTTGVATKLPFTTQ